MRDITFDGLADILANTTNCGNYCSVVVVPGNAAAGLGQPVLSCQVPFYYMVPPPLIEDFTGDGIADVVGLFGNWAPPPLSWTPWIELRIGDGNGGFSPPLVTVLATNLGSFLEMASTAGDGDGDGDPDLFFHTLGGSGWSRRGIALNDIGRGTGCAAPGSVAPSVYAPRALPGDTGFGISLLGATPGTPALLGLSLGVAAAPGPCGQPLIDLTPTQMILPAGPVGFTLTSGTGTASVGLPIPNLPALLGFRANAQWGVVEPASALGFSLTPVRTIIVW